jgi:hypothetical protein
MNVVVAEQGIVNNSGRSGVAGCAPPYPVSVIAAIITTATALVTTGTHATGGRSGGVRPVGAVITDGAISAALSCV